MKTLLDVLQTFSPLGAGVFFLVVNGLIVAASALLNHWIRSRWRHRAIVEGTDPITFGDMALVVSSTILNTVVSVVGWSFWKEGSIQLRSEGIIATPLSLVVFTLLMDAGMYLTHRLAHWAPLYRLFHYRHHQHQRTNVVSLFVLHPLEVIGFGALMLVVIAVVAPSPIALSVYLMLNILFGTIGHTGVEALVPAVAEKFPFRWLGTSRFHMTHHEREETNFGFTAIPQRR